MNLSTRIERLEKETGMRDMPLPNIIVTFTEPTRDAEGRMRQGKCCGGLRIIPMVGQQRLDADLNPTGAFEYAGRR